MRILGICAFSLLVSAAAAAANFDGGYKARVGDIDSDGDSDIYLHYLPEIVPIALDDIFIPVPRTRRSIAEFVLLKTATGGFVSAAPTANQLSTARQLPLSQIRFVLGDFNADRNMDLLLDQVGSAISGAQNAFVFAPSAAGATPIGVKAIDSAVQQFVSDLNGITNDPGYFDSGWTLVRTEIHVFSLDTYWCGDDYYPDLGPVLPDPDDPWGPPVPPWSGLPNGGTGCTFVGVAQWNVPIDFWEFDPSSFSAQAVNIYFRLRNYLPGTGPVTIPVADAAFVKDQFESLFGVAFDSAPQSPDNVLVKPQLEPKKPIGGFLGKLGMATRLLNIITGVLAWTDTSDDDFDFEYMVHYGYWVDQAKFATGMRRDSYVTDDPLVSGLTAQQLYSLPPKNSADAAPDGFYSVFTDDTTVKEPPFGFTEIQRTFSGHGITVTRQGGGHAYLLPIGTLPGTVSGPFPLPPN